MLLLSRQLSLGQPRQLSCSLQARMKVLTLQQQISGLYKAMPRDLKQLLLSSPQRAAVLQASDPDWQVRHRTPAGCSDYSCLCMEAGQTGPQ